MKKRNIFAALTSLVLVFSILVFNGCGKEDQPESSLADATAVYSEATKYAEVTYVTPITSVNSEEETTAVSQSVSETVSQTAAEETTAASALVSVEEIVEYFNASANKIKPAAKKVVKNYEKRTVNEEKLVFPKSLESTARSLIGTFMKDDTEPIVYETREDITNEFLVPNQSYVSRLKPEWVKSATCKDNGKEYIIHIRLKDQKNPTSGNGVGAVCDVIEAAEVAEKASFVEKFTTDYYNCEVIATVDKASGNVVHIRYITPVALELTVNLFGTHDVAAGLTFEKDYTITY
ncbi:MAG: hypothetical protein IJZ07_05855 [Clostridia bacterium]|nr:hypothetical protein [Clostridia bacterium]